MADYWDSWGTPAPVTEPSPSGGGGIGWGGEVQPDTLKLLEKQRKLDEEQDAMIANGQRQQMDSQPVSMAMVYAFLVPR